MDFPLFELDPETGAHVPAHHPFTAPHPDDVQLLETDPGRCRALHYDAVYNGNELGSGSIRITDPAVQRTIFGLLGIPGAEIRRRFGFLLDGLAAGAPPHGGFALGFDRIAMLLAGADSLRDVIAFPKTTAARALFEGAPTQVDPRDLAGAAPGGERTRRRVEAHDRRSHHRISRRRAPIRCCFAGVNDANLARAAARRSACGSRSAATRVTLTGPPSSSSGRRPSCRDCSTSRAWASR